MTDSKALIKRLRFCWLTLTRDEIHQAADAIEKLETDNARLNDALRQAVIDAAEWARKAGEAQGKLEISEAAGILDGWVRDCERLRADNARLREALEGLKAAVDDLDNPFDASASGEMHYGFERAVDDATLVIEAALQETSHDA